MTPIQENKKTDVIRRLLLLCSGLSGMAFGVAFSIKAYLGTSPISSLPYVTSVLSGLSVGTTTILMNTFFILLQIMILRKRYQWFQLLQFPAVLLFGSMIDLAEKVLEGISLSGYLQQWILCLIGIFLVALGVSMEVTADLVTTAGEGVVLAICQVAAKKFSNIKVGFDVTLVMISVLLSLVFLGHLEGVREGTIAAAVLVGVVTRSTNKMMKQVEKVIL